MKDLQILEKALNQANENGSYTLGQSATIHGALTRTATLVRTLENPLPKIEVLKPETEEDKTKK